MKIKNTFFTLIVVLISLNSAVAQIGVGTTNPDNVSALDITTKDKSLLPPRMTENDRDNITPLQAYKIIINNVCKL